MHTLRFHTKPDYTRCWQRLNELNQNISQGHNYENQQNGVLFINYIRRGFVARIPYVKDLISTNPARIEIHDEGLWLRLLLEWPEGVALEEVSGG